jgi:hypothetical protein
MFSLPRYKEVLDSYPTTLDVISALQRFFLSCSGLQLDVSNPLTIAQSSTLYPTVDRQKRRNMMRNIAAFIGEYLGLGENPGLPLRMDCPQIVTETINAILTVHTALRSTSLWQYCDECPFTRTVTFTDALLISTALRVWQAIRVRFPALELIAVGATPVVDTRGCFRDSRFRFPAGVCMDVAMKPSDALLVVFILPLILQFDAVGDFANDEIIGRVSSQE